MRLAGRNSNGSISWVRDRSLDFDASILIVFASRRILPLCLHLLRLLHIGHRWPEAFLGLTNNPRHGHRLADHSDRIHCLREVRSGTNLPFAALEQLRRRHQLRHLFHPGHDPILLDVDCAALLSSHE